MDDFVDLVGTEAQYILIGINIFKRLQSFFRRHRLYRSSGQERK